MFASNLRIKSVFMLLSSSSMLHSSLTLKQPFDLKEQTKNTNQISILVKMHRQLPEEIKSPSLSQLKRIVQICVNIYLTKQND